MVRCVKRRRATKASSQSVEFIDEIDSGRVSASPSSAEVQWSPCARFSTLAAGRTVSLAQLASSDQAELLLSPLSVCLDGVPMLATGRGLYFEHVSRMGSVLTAVQRTRQCSTGRDGEHIYICMLPPPGHPQRPLCAMSRPHDPKPARGGRTDVCAVHAESPGKDRG